MWEFTVFFIWSIHIYLCTTHNICLGTDSPTSKQPPSNFLCPPGTEKLKKSSQAEKTRKPQ